MSKLCIEFGKYYRTRGGQKVGPICPWQGSTDPWPFAILDGNGNNIASYDKRGVCCDGKYPAGLKPSGDLIAEWSDLDLTAITTPFGLLDAETQEALKAHGGPYEWYASCDGWAEWTPNWDWPNTYRVKPAPPKPRERWAYGAHMHDTLEAAEAFRARVDAQNPGNGYLGEPITRWVEVLA